MTTTKKQKPRNRAAQDSTLINLRAVKKRLDVVEKQIRELWSCLIESPTPKKAR